jgi:hypothetical protein
MVEKFVLVQILQVLVFIGRMVGKHGQMRVV